MATDYSHFPFIILLNANIILELFHFTSVIPEKMLA